MPRLRSAPPVLRALLRVAALVAPLAAASAADLGDPGGYGPPAFAGRGFGPQERYEPVVPHHPPRIVTRPPGYVGSDYGLGKPAFTGLGSRPDWGRSGE